MTHDRRRPVRFELALDEPLLGAGPGRPVAGLETEIRRMLEAAAQEPTAAPGRAPGVPSQPDEVEAWVRSLHPGETGTARAWLPRFLEETVEAGAWTPRSFAAELARLQGSLLERRRDRTNLFHYTRRAG